MKSKLLRSMLCISIMTASYLGAVTHGIDIGLFGRNILPTSEARLVDVSIKKERKLSERAIKEIKKDPEVIAIRDNSDLLHMQDEIVGANPDILWYKDATHDYGLRPVKEIEYNAMGEKSNKTAFNASDGFIFVTSAFIKKNHPSTIYNNSALAFTLGHEIAHWKNDQLLRCTNAQQRDFELQADSSALEYMDGTLAYGYGGRLIALHRFAYGQKSTMVDPKHAPLDVAYHDIADYINDISKGRIKIDINGNCTYDGKPLVALNNSKMAPHSNVLEVVAEERTMYVAGQIAFAIKYGVWNNESKSIVTQDDLYHNGNDSIVLVVNNPKSGGYKIIDIFDIKKSRWLEIMDVEIRKDEDYFDNLNEEEKYFLQLWRST